MEKFPSVKEGDEEERYVSNGMNGLQLSQNGSVLNLSLV